MSVTGHNVISDSQGSSLTLKTRTLTMMVEVFTSSANDEQRVVEAYMLAQGYTPGSNYAWGNGSDSTVILKRMDIKRAGDRGVQKVWLVTLTYETPDDEDATDENGDATSNPLEYYGQIETGFVVFDAPVTKATNIKAFPLRPIDTEGPITTSAGEIVIPPPLRTSHYLYLRLTKNCATYNADLAYASMNTVNSDLARIFSRRIGFEMFLPKYTAKIANIGATWQQENGYSFWRVQTEILVKYPSWRHFELDAGYFAIAETGDPDGNNGSIAAADIIDGRWNVRRVQTVFGQDTTKPVLLDGSGKVKLKAGGKIDPTYLEYKIYPEFPWAGLLASVFPR